MNFSSIKHSFVLSCTDLPWSCLLDCQWLSFCKGLLQLSLWVRVNRLWWVFRTFAELSQFMCLCRYAQSCICGCAAKYQG